MRPFARVRAALLVAAIACVGPLPVPRPAPPEPARPEPPAAAAFVAAHVRADAAPVALVTSPLYRAEAARRGRPAGLDPLWAEAARLVAFVYVGGLVDERGFAHALYTARPRRPGADGPTTVWRLDLDPRGRVVWGEPVRLLPGTGVRSVVGGHAAADPAALPSPDGWASLSPDEVVGVRAENGAGYYAVGLHRGAGRPRPAAVLFVIADDAGGLTRDPWSFGRPLPIGDAAGGRVLARPYGTDEPGLSVDERELLRAYLRTLA